MISRQMQAMLGQNSVIRAMFEEGERLRAEYGSDKVYDFSLGNPNVPAPPRVEQAMREVIDEEPSVMVHGYMNNAGFPDVRKELALTVSWQAEERYRADQFIMTTGAAAALNILLKTILNPGDEVLSFKPYFSEYKNYVENYGAVLKLVATDPETFLPNLDALRAAIGEKTRALILNSPNNPSGVIYSEELLRGIQAVLAEKEREFGNCILVISDEPYRELVYDGAKVPWVPKIMPHAAVVYSYSKTLSLPGERIGWLLLPDSIPESRDIYRAAVIANRISGFVNAPSYMQRVLKRAHLFHSDFSVYARNRALLLKELPAMGYHLVKPEGAFYLLLKAPNGDDAAFATKLKEERILTVPCTSFACPGYVRLAYCVAETTVQNALQGFRNVAGYYRGQGLL
ncbi:pyridoxal phosphate-dependent aminotransferase [Stomatobaculum longum]|uniref:pyridoxal phosphate-dependent aminotransferase n=1 Tax=Stomatobaculum longum TaxID=796942 RepID=UPI0028F0B762|nr:pyridoxal phosphate-dependent aminotransferase [Stomatobaculum longum]